MNYFITAIGTDSGKTLASSIVTTALGADYWKPIQAGNPTDSNTVRSLVNDGIRIHKEAYFLRKPASPHDAAKEEGILIDLDDINYPLTDNKLVIEGAGGLLVPLNNDNVIADIIKKFDAEIILVSNLYLGSINHTLLTLEAIEARNLKLKGIIFNGPENKASMDIILKKANAPCLLHIEQQKSITPETVTRYAGLFKKRWNELGFER